MKVFRSGWVRLWVVLSAFWLLFVANQTLSRMPTLEMVAHRPEFLARVEPQSVLWKCEGAISEAECAATAPEKATMPNGYVMLLSRTNIEDPELLAALHSYLGVIKQENARSRRENIEEGIVRFAIPSVGLLLFGLGIAWVREGFIRNASPPTGAKT
jgi:hypothetical protein